MRRRDVLGIPMAITDYAEAMDVMDQMIADRVPGWVVAAAVHAVMVAQHDELTRRALTDSVITVPDGMPIVWAANCSARISPTASTAPS